MTQQTAANSFRVLDDLWVPLRDGRRLAARLWLPAEADRRPVPAILEYLPYRRRDGTAARDETTYPVFCRAGYAGVRVDIAGSGDSDGHLSDEYSEDELTIGEEVIAWIASQTWCSGAVGMIGISWGGFNALQIAMRRPKALKAIVTVCSSVDRYADDIHYMGGCLLLDNFTWGAQMTAYSTRPPDPTVRDDWRELWMARLERLPFLAAEWLRHPRRDGYWKHGSVCEDWAAIDCPVLAIGGWADAYSNTPAELVEHLKVSAKALVGPWEHKYPHIARIGPATDFHGEVLHWFDHWLKDARNGAENLPAYRAYIQDHGAPKTTYGPRPGRWIAEKTWPTPNIAVRRLHLSKEGLTQEPSAGTAEVASPQHTGMTAGYFCPGMRVESELPDDQRQDDALSLCFDTPPLPEPFEILGAAEVELTFSVDKPSALLALRLNDVAPDGTSARVTYRPINLAHRDSHEAPRMLEAGQQYRVKCRLNQAGHRFARGHRIRLALSSSYWPIVWPSPEPAKVTLHLKACRLLLPCRDASHDEADIAPPAPRAFPTLAAETLRESGSKTQQDIHDDGTRVLRTFDDFGLNRDPVHGLETGSSVEQVFSIHPGDPLSARAEAHWSFTLGRGAWRTRIESENVMTSTTLNFHLTRRVRAYENDALVFEREWRQEIPRDHM